MKPGPKGERGTLHNQILDVLREYGEQGISFNNLLRELNKRQILGSPSTLTRILIDLYDAKLVDYRKEPHPGKGKKIYYVTDLGEDSAYIVFPRSFLDVFVEKFAKYGVKKTPEQIALEALLLGMKELEAFSKRQMKKQKMRKKARTSDQ